MRLGNGLRETASTTNRLQPSQMTLHPSEADGLSSENYLPSIGHQYPGQRTADNGNVWALMISAPLLSPDPRQSSSYGKATVASDSEALNRLALAGEDDDREQGYAYDRFGYRGVAGFIPTRH